MAFFGRETQGVRYLVEEVPLGKDRKDGHPRKDMSRRGGHADGNKMWDEASREEDYDESLRRIMRCGQWPVLFDSVCDTTALEKS